MADIHVTYNDKVRYTFQHSGFGNKTIKSQEVIGWNDDEKELFRNKDYSGIFPKFSNALKFWGEAREYINSIRAIYGSKASIRMIKEVLDDDLIWQRSYTGFLTMRTWEDENGIVSLKFDSGGLEKTLKARQKDKFEIERTEDVNGKPIPELELKKLALPGRRIFLITKFETNSNFNQAAADVESNAGGTRFKVVGIPIQLTAQSHDLANSVIVNSTSNEAIGTTGMMFYANNDRPRSLRIKLDVALNAFFQQYENVQWCRYQICLTTYENGINYNVKDRKVLTWLDSGAGVGTPGLPQLPENVIGPYPTQFSIPLTASYDWELDEEIHLLEGESLALECLLGADMYNSNTAGVRVFANNIQASLKIDEDSYYQPTQTNGLLAYELLERLVEIMTGSKKNFKSNYFGRTDIGYPVNGPGAYIFFAHGHWIRQFEDGDELYKPFATSFKQVLETLMIIENVGLGIRRNGFDETIIIEENEYFYNNNVTIRLGEMVNGKFEYLQVKNVKRSVEEDLYFSSIEIGSDKAGEYEEVFGLEETNTKANLTTSIDFGETFDKVSKDRWDNFGEEIIRRRNKFTRPTEDQSGDLDIWVHDAKKGQGDIYELKKWQDVCATEPIGFFDVDSAYNFRWSPIQLVIKHGWFLNGGLQETPLDQIRFGSSTGKSSVTIQQIGANAYAENGNIPIQDLPKARFTPEKIEFEYEVNTKLAQQLDAQVTIIDKKIPAIYGLIEFKNERGEIEKARLKSVKPNKKGSWTVIKYRR